MIRTKKTARYLGCLLLCIWALPGAAEPPPLVQYQGVVLAPDGSPREGPIDLELRIFDAASGGNLLFSETHPGAALVDGVFTVALGAQQILDPALFGSPGTRWLEVVAAGEVLSPRQQILAVPYSLDAATVGGQTPSQIAIAPSPVSGFQQISAGTSTESIVSATCPPGKAAVGGGCDCAGSMVDSRPVGGDNSWRCECSAAGANQAWVLCADAAGVCGNGILDGGEQCDGTHTSNCATGACAQGCVCGAELCGDGVVGPTEPCDDGNTSDFDNCLTSCVVATCGDGLLDAQPPGVEQCDTTGASASCDADCTVAFCGDNTVNSVRGETCDPGSAGMTSSCDFDCSFPACGDGLVNGAAGELCDDGNSNSRDNCTNSCRAAACGDGFLDQQPPGIEECDDGNSSNSDACINNCKSAVCGDGFVNFFTEQCDDGNLTNGDGCSAECLIE